MYYLVPVGLLAVLYLGAQFVFPGLSFVVNALYLVLTIVLTLGIVAITIRKLRQLDLPEFYIRQVFISRALTLLGFFVLIVALGRGGLAPDSAASWPRIIL